MPKTAVITPFGLFQYLAMPFGLRNAGQTLQRYIHQSLGELDFVFVYIDDILIASASPEEHEAHIRIVLERLRDFHLRINVDKCQFGMPELEFLGHVVDREGLKPTPDKVEAIKKYPRPRTVVELRRFLGMANFYWRSLPRAAAAQAPLNKYLQNSRKNDKTEIAWTAEAETAFRQIKENLANAAILAHPLRHGDHKGRNRRVRFRDGCITRASPR